MEKNKTLMASIKIEKNGDGFLASVPGLQGAFAEGDTIDEAIFNCVDVIKLIMEYRKDMGRKECGDERHGVSGRGGDAFRGQRKKSPICGFPV